MIHGRIFADCRWRVVSRVTRLYFRLCPAGKCSWRHFSMCRRQSGGIRSGEVANLARNENHFEVCTQAECLRLGMPNCLPRAAANLLPTSDCGMYCLVKTVDFNEVKRQEANSRMAAARKARRSPQAAAALQQRASLVGNGAKWRITNFKQVARAMAQWA